MIWFLLAAAISVGAFDWSGGGGSRRYWTVVAGALLAFGLSLTIDSPPAGGECAITAGIECRAGFLVFLGLFLVSSAFLGWGALFGRLAPGAFVGFALSDLALALAVWSAFGETSAWSLPSVGGWGAASGWGALAALLRLGAPLAGTVTRPASILQAGHKLFRGPGLSFSAAPTSADLLQGGMLAVGWLQGALLAWWVGTTGSSFMVLGGLILWPAAAAIGRPAVASLCAGGGLIAIAAALGVGSAGLAATGLASVALALGEPLLGFWVLSALPLSIVSILRLPSPLALPPSPSGTLGGPASNALFWFGSVVLFPLAWAVVASRPRLSRSAGRGTRAPVLPGALLASIFAGVAVILASGSPNWLMWMTVGAAAGLLFAGVCSRPAPAPAPDSPQSRVTAKASVASGTGASSSATDSPSAPDRPDGRSPKPPRSGDWMQTHASVTRPQAGLATNLRRTAFGWGVAGMSFALFGWLLWTGLQTGFL